MNVWDERYRKHDTVYGVMPNAFWASQLALLPEGSVCLPCDGEGRNAVHAAEQGWSVYAFDASPEGVRKSARLAQDRGVSIEVEVADALQVDVTQTFDVVGLIFAHMPVELRERFHQRAWSWVKPGGRLIVEGFHKTQLGLGSGGPKGLDMLYDEGTFVEDIAKGSDCARVLWNARCEQILDEGPFHQGAAVTSQWVIQKMDDGAL